MTYIYQRDKLIIMHTNIQRQEENTKSMQLSLQLTIRIWKQTMQWNVQQLKEDFIMWAIV